MARIFLVFSLLGCLLVPAGVRAEVYFAFSAEQIEYYGQQRIFFVPFSFSAPTQRMMERKIAILFEKLHSSRRAVYGDSYLVVREADGKCSATIHLDPEAARFHDIILGELYLTLTTIGIADIVRADSGKAVTDTDVKYPYFMPTVPLWEALPPASYDHALIRLEGNLYLESHSFFERMKARDADLYRRIVALLQSGDGYVRMTVLKAFPYLQVADESKHLIPMLEDPELTIVYKVIELLSAKKEPAVLDALARVADATSDPETQLRAARILVENGKANYQLYILFEELKSSDPAVVIQTIQKLAASGDKRVLKALVRQLLHANAAVKDAAFAGLKQIRDLPTLEGLLLNREIEERFRKDTALELMRQNEAPSAKVGIDYLVRNHEGEAAVEAITTIEMRAYKDLADLLVFALEHKDEKVAHTAAMAIGKLELVDLIPQLSAACGRSFLVGTARETIARLLATQPLKTVMKKATEPDIIVRELSVLALVKEAKDQAAKQKDIEPILELLGESMKDKETVIKRAAVQALQEIGGTRNWKRLMRMKKDPAPEVRRIVLQAALSLVDEEGDGVILELLADEEDSVRIEAIRAISTRKLKPAREKLKFLVESRDKKLKAEVLRTIVALNETADEHKEFYEIYKKLIFEMDADIQLFAVQGLQWIIDPMVVPLLQSGILLMHKDERVRAATLIALGRSRDHNVVEHIARGFADGEKSVQMAAIEGLRLMGHKKGITPLQEFIKQSDDVELNDLAQAAIEALQIQPKGLLDD